MSNNANSAAKLFEKIKVMFQDLPSRIKSNIYPELRNQKIRRFNPMMIGDMLHMSKNRYIGIIMALNFFKEPMPWL